MLGGRRKEVSTNSHIYIYIYTSVDLLIYISNVLLDEMSVGCAVWLAIAG